jgi:phage shock protein E
MKRDLFIATAAFLFSGIACAPSAPVVKPSETPIVAEDTPPTPTVTGTQARALVAAGAKLIDVRDAEDFAEGHIDGATNIPVDTIEENPSTVGSKDQPMVLYCRSGRRSHRAAEALRAAGYTKVETLGAMSNWDE